MSDYVRPQWRVAFDLGSAFSTFAYCRTNRIHIGGPWKSFQGHHYSKMPTALLYNEAGHVEKYGFDWLKVTNAADAQRYFDYFKKKADEEEDSPFWEESVNGRGESKNRMKLHVDMLIQLKKEFFEKAKETEGENFVPQLHEVEWLMCVPTKWAVKDRQYMIAVAYQAGLIAELTSPNLHVILEGDAAFAGCMHKDVEFKEYCLTPADLAKIKQSQCDLVADIGGCTVDTALRTWSSDVAMAEYREQDGTIAGGQGVNLAFENKLVEVLGRECVEAYKERDFLTWLRFMHDFEGQKKDHGTRNSDGVYISQGVNTLKELYHTTTERNLASVLNEGNSGLHLDDDHNLLKISKELLNELFNDTVNSITEHIASKVDKAEVVYLVGGFANSQYLHDKIQARVIERTAGRQVLVVTPKDPELSVVVGAIHYSRSRENLFLHTMDANYGVVTRQYLEEEDPEERALKYAHMLNKQRQALQGHVYEVIVTWEELPDRNVVQIYRDDDMTFKTIRLERNQQLDVHKIRVQLQITESSAGERLLQITVTDEITKACYIERVKVNEYRPSEPPTPPQQREQQREQEREQQREQEREREQVYQRGYDDGRGSARRRSVCNQQ